MLRIVFKIGDLDFEVHQCPVGQYLQNYMGRFITEKEALSLPFQVPTTGNHIYLRLEPDGSVEFTVGVFRNLEDSNTSAWHAQALLQMLKHQGRVPKGGKDDMRGIMLCFGYRPERRTGGPVNSYVSHNCDDSWEACKKQWACFVDALQHDLNVYCPVQALESAIAQHLFDTPTMTPQTFFTNLTVTFQLCDKNSSRQ